MFGFYELMIITKVCLLLTCIGVNLVSDRYRPTANFFQGYSKQSPYWNNTRLKLDCLASF